MSRCKCIAHSFARDEGLDIVCNVSKKVTVLLDVIDYVQILFKSIKSMRCLYPQSGFDLDAKTVLLIEKSKKKQRTLTATCSLLFRV